MLYHNKYTCHSEHSEESINVNEGKLIFCLNTLKYFFIIQKRNCKSWIASILADFAMTERITFFLSPLPLGEGARRAGEGLKQKYAFTLAEVLITLGIIGVVAALTLPNLIAKWQMKAYETAFKKEYSVIQNTINFIAVDESLNACYAYLERNETNGWYVSVTDDCSALKNGLISRLKLKKIENDFYKLYALKDTVLANGGITINSGVTYDYWVKISDAYLIPDGAVLLMISPEDTSINSFSDTTFVIDINGKKGPNKWGYDVFYMVLTAKNAAKNIRLTDEMASLAEKGGKLPRTILQNKNENTDFRWDW